MPKLTNTSGERSICKCRVCGGDVLPPRRVYCIDECKRRWKNDQRHVTELRQRQGGKLYIARVCQDCGIEYTGHIKSKRCPACQAEAKRRASAEYKERKAHGRTRALGSKDLCALCGREYVVVSSLQRYCKGCAEFAILQNTRAHKRNWNKEYYADGANRERKNSVRRKDWRAERKCIICGKNFMPESPNQTICGEECLSINRRNKQYAEYAKRRHKLNKEEDHG